MAFDLDDEELKATRRLNKAEKEIEVGEWVKLDNGNIGQVIAVEKGSIMLDIVQNRWVGMCCIKKHSKNIIDLIEVGDYVNGSKVIDIAQGKTKAVFIESQEQKFALIPIVEKQIKSIVTKEQFAQMKYEVKE